MSNTSRGKAFEAEARKILEAKGYLVERAINKTIFLGPGKIMSVAHDFWGCFDLLGAKEGLPMLLVSVTVWEAVSPRIKKLQAFPDGAWEKAIYARMRGGRGPHFRILYGQYGYDWEGHCEMVIR